MKTMLLFNMTLGLLAVSTAAYAGADAGPIKGNARVSVHSLRCETGADGQTVTRLDERNQLFLFSAPKLELTHSSAVAAGCNPYDVEALKTRAVEYYLFAPAEVAVERQEQVTPVSETGLCHTTLVETVTISFAPWAFDLTLTSVATKDLGLADCKAP